MVTSSYKRIWILFLLSLLVSPFRGKATKLPKKVEQVGLIYRTGNIGDMIFCTPLFRALKQERPDTHMTVVGRKHNAETLRYNPDVDQYLNCPDTPFALWKMVRAQKIDYAYLINPSVIDFAMFYLAGVPAIASFSTTNKAAETKAYRIIKKLCLQVEYDAGENVAQKNLRLLEPLGIASKDTQKHLYYSEEGKATIATFLEEHAVTDDTAPIVALAPGAGTKIKQWPADRFAQVADYLYKKHQVPVFIIGGPGDTEEFKELQAALAPETVVVSCLHHSIDELKAFTDRIDLVVANDSAPIYVAEAFLKATITIVGPTDENEHPPKGELHVVVKAEDRGVPALKSHLSLEQQFDDAYAREQIESVTLEQVLEAVDELVPRLSGR